MPERHHRLALAFAGVEGGFGLQIGVGESGIGARPDGDDDDGAPLGGVAGYSGGPRGLGMP